MNGAKIDHPNNQILAYNTISAQWGAKISLGSLQYD